MGFQQRMMNMWMGRKNPEDIRAMMAAMMENVGSGAMGQMMPRMMAKMGPEQVEHMMEDVMPGLMDTCFAEMDQERREIMLAHCRGMLDQMEQKYMAPAAS